MLGIVFNEFVEMVEATFSAEHVERMIAAAVEDSENGHNVYVEGRLVRPGLRGNARGTLADTAAVFALVVDSDADRLVCSERICMPTCSFETPSICCPVASKNLVSISRIGCCFTLKLSVLLLSGAKPWTLWPAT